MVFRFLRRQLHGEEITMLHAVSPESQSLGLFRLVLKLIANDDRRIPQDLRDRFICILGEASQLAAHPSDPSITITIPESIDLAVFMVGDVEIRQAFQEIGSFESMDSQKARKILSQLGQRAHATAL
jgi:hypothetical protein